MRNVALVVAIFALPWAVSGSEPITVTVPLSEYHEVSAKIDNDLTLRVHGGPSDYQVEVTSKKPVIGCHHNLVYRAPHGPDPSSVFPWHVQKRYFPNVRTLPVCGFPLAIEVRISNPSVAGEGPDAKFTGGDLSAVCSQHPSGKKSQAAAPN